ncbi:hypothetical protein ACFQV2_35315 [Actinokineospora soli]|uniref:Uncharacterized protein n=1 Tax=Actinokineospora soli TaxID=1048753 RepID=A0ABW2TYC6_9PSEU
MNQEFAESVARFRAELASAITRSRRAAAEARSHSAALRREVEDAAEAKTKPADPPPSDPDDEDFSEQTILFRP